MREPFRRHVGALGDKPKQESLRELSARPVTSEIELEGVAHEFGHSKRNKQI